MASPRNVARSCGMRQTSWTSLPAEIRLMILEAIASLRLPGWASFASVCREWQFVIENANFSQLRLQESSLDDFSRYTIRTRSIVRHICFNIELPRYTCEDCQSSTEYSHNHPNNKVMSGGLRALFEVLSEWEVANCLVLELNAYSPSDSTHWFKHYNFSSNDKADQESERHDPPHGWVNGRQVKQPPVQAFLRLFEKVVLNFQETYLLCISAVRTLIIRRQLRRRITPTALFLILKRFTCLEALIFEPWRSWEPECRAIFDHHFSSVIRNHLPNTLKVLSIFEDFDEGLMAALQADDASVPEGVEVDMKPARETSLRLTKAFLTRSLSLTQFSASFLIDGELFFRCCTPDLIWSNLQLLALTSQLLDDERRRVEVYDLLTMAGNTALQMPWLDPLVIWSGFQGNACTFVYRAERGRASITWCGTWELRLKSSSAAPMREAWQKVAAKYHLPGLRVVEQRIRATILSHGDAIHRLNLPCKVVSQSSLREMLQEDSESKHVRDVREPPSDQKV